MNKLKMPKAPFLPSNKSEEFPQILQPWRLSLRNFWGISWESFPVTDSSEILEKFPRIGPQDERFVGSQFWDSVSRNPWEILQNFSPQNSSEFLQQYSVEIPEKFLGLCYHVYGFFREFIKRISFEKFLGISPEFHPKKFLRNSSDYFSGNSWEILRTWSPYLGIFRGIK